MTSKLAVRIRNGRYDGLISGMIHGGLKFSLTDPGGFRSASFQIDQRMKHRSDIIQPYSRVYVLNKANGDVVFEGDVSHPGRSTTDQGNLLEVAVEGPADRLNDWSGAYIYVDRDFAGWTKNMATSVISTSLDVGDDRGGSGSEAINLSFPMNQHVELNHRIEAQYQRIRDAGQELGWFNYAWDGGHTSGSPGWLVRSIASPPSTVVRSQILNVGGSGGSGAVVGGSLPTGSNYVLIQLIWTSGSSSTGNSGSDICWASILRPIVICRLRNADGTFINTANYDDYVTASKVVNDLLGNQLLNDFDGVNARIDAGAGFTIAHLAFPDGTTPREVLEEVMKFEPGCTYVCGPSNPTNDKYSFTWMTRSPVVRYEVATWAQQYSGGNQPVDQFNRAVARWKSPVGNPRTTITTQSIPEMDAVGRTRTFFQDLTDKVSDSDNAVQANVAVLEEHRYPKNGGRLSVSGQIIDRFTGRRVEPFEIQPGYLIRLVGVEPSPDALTATSNNGSSVRRILSNDYDDDSETASLELDSVSFSLFRAIARANLGPQPRRVRR